MSKSLVLVLSAFSGLAALGALVHEALSPSPPGGAGLAMLTVIVVGALCWLRWRLFVRNIVLVPALIAGAAILTAFAVLGVGRVIRFSSLIPVDSPSRSVMDLFLGVQAALILYQLWKDRTRGERASGVEQGQDPGAE